MREIDWEKRARELMPKTVGLIEHGLGGMQVVEVARQSCCCAALQLAREMACARTEEIASFLDRRADSAVTSESHAVLRQAATDVRSFKKKTREEVLEEALQAIARRSVVGDAHLRPEEWALPRDERAVAIALRALEWKP